MKINFDSLYAETTPKKSQYFLINSFSFDSVPAKEQISTYTLLTQDTPPPLQPYRKNLKKPEEVQKNLELQMPKEVKLKKVDIQEITKRVYEVSPCNKKQCKQLQLQKTNRELMEYLQTKKQFKANSSFNYLRDQEADVFERLHNESKLRTFLQKNKQTSDHRLQTSIKGQGLRKASSKYLKNYVPFYERLESIISKSQEKKKFLESNPHLALNSKQKYFTPVLYKSQYTDITSRYSKDLSHSRQACSFKYQDSLETSFQSISSLDKSVQLVNDIQQYFFNRMECIFVNRETDQVEITQQNIKLLSSVEFKIMQEFIMELEKNPVEAQLFVDKLQHYYENLGFRDKQELRVHEAKLKKYSRKNKPNTKEEKSQKTLAKPCSKNAKTFEKDLLFV